MPGAGERLVIAAAALGRREHRRPVARAARSAGGPRRCRCSTAAFAAAGVVGDDRVGVDEARRAVDEHERGAGLALAPEVSLIAAARHDQQPVDAARGERLGELALAGRLLVRGTGEREHAVAAGHVLDAAMDRREERVGDVLDDQADRRREPVVASQRARHQVAPVAEDLDRVLHAPRQVRADVVAAVDDARDRGEAHAGEVRDVLHRRPPGRTGHFGGLENAFTAARTLSRQLRGCPAA